MATWSMNSARLHAREPGILRDRSELRRVEQRHQRAADQVRARLGSGRDTLDAHARRHLVRRAMLIEGLAGDAVRKALHHERPVGKHGQDQRRDAHVMTKQVALRQRACQSDPGVRGPEQFSEIRHLTAAGKGDRPSTGTLLNLVELRQQRLTCALCGPARACHVPPARRTRDDEAVRPWSSPRTLLEPRASASPSERVLSCPGRRQRAVSSSSARATASRPGQAARR